MADTEKAEDGPCEVEQVNSKNYNGSDEDLAMGFTPKEQKRIIRRVDCRLVTTAGILYCISLIDRTNLGVAVIAGMKGDLDLVGFRYSIISLVFFVTYVVFQPPSTILVRKLGPRVHMSAIAVAWGAIMIGMGFAPSYHVMIGLRLVLGVLEAGFFPSMVYLLSTWYTRYEVGRRYSLFYVLGSVAAAFAGILAFGFTELKGTHGLNGWRWIFIIEGAMTVGLGVIGYMALVDFPDGKHGSWHFLGKRETQFIINRVNADRGDVHTEPFDLKRFLVAGLDLKVWGFALIFGFNTTITYALAYFLPVILRTQMHFTVPASQCLTAPPYVVSGILMYAIGWAGDRVRLRGPFILFNMILCVIGLPIMGWHHNPAVRYFGVFLVTSGANANVPVVMAYQANNIRGQWKRAFCSATLVGFGGIGGIAGSLIFRDQDAPHYFNGMWGCITAALLMIITVCLLDIKFWFDNRKADRGESVIEGSDGSFRYTY